MTQAEFIPAVTEAIDPIEDEKPLNADDEALQRLWNELNSADDKYTMWIERALDDSHKVSKCFSARVTGPFDDVIARCMDYIPAGDQSAEFIIKIKGKDGHYIPGGNKRMILQKSNSQMADKNDPMNSEVMKMMSRQFQNQQETQASFLEKMLEGAGKGQDGLTAVMPLILESMKPKENTLLLGLLTMMGPALLEFLKPREALKPVSLHEQVETLVLLQGVINPDKSGDEDPDSWSSIIKNLAAPIATGAAALAQRPAQLPKPQIERVAPISGASEIESKIAQENESRAALTKLPEETQGAQEVLTKMVGLALNGARRNADPIAYAMVLVDQLEDAHYIEFHAFLLDPNAIVLLGAMNPAVTEYEDWFSELFKEMKVELDSILTENKEENRVAENTSAEISPDATTDTNDIAANPVGASGDESHIESNETADT